MTREENDLLVSAVPAQPQLGTRRRFLHRAAIAGAVGIGSLLPLALPDVKASPLLGRDDDDSDDLKRRDHNILIAAEIAEALAVTTYTNIIDGAPFFSRLPADDQGYLVAAREEEMSHYLLEQSVTEAPTPFRSFFYPKGMFEDAQTTLNVLVTLEDAFIAAYLVGVRHFSTADLRVTAARIMGIESDHRTLARVLAGDVASQDGGPIEKITGRAGSCRTRRSSQQQRLRTHALLEEHRPGCRCAHAVRRHERGQSGRVRYL